MHCMGFYACSKYVDRRPVITCLFTVCLLIDTLCRFSHFKEAATIQVEGIIIAAILNVLMIQ